MIYAVPVHVIGSNAYKNLKTVYVLSVLMSKVNLRTFQFYL